MHDAPWQGYVSLVTRHGFKVFNPNRLHEGKQQAHCQERQPEAAAKHSKGVKQQAKQEGGKILICHLNSAPQQLPQHKHTQHDEGSLHRQPPASQDGIAATCQQGQEATGTNGAAKQAGQPPDQPCHQTYMQTRNYQQVYDTSAVHQLPFLRGKGTGVTNHQGIDQGAASCVNQCLAKRRFHPGPHQADRSRLATQQDRGRVRPDITPASQALGKLPGFIVKKPRVD